MHARGAGPLETHRLEFLAESENAIFADVEGVVVEEKFLGLRKHFVRLLEFARHALHGTHAPRVAGKGLGPQAERAKRRTAARGVKGNIRIKQEWNIVIFNFQILLVHFGREGKFIELGGLQQRTRRIVHDFPVFHIARAQDLGKRLALCVFHDGMIEFAAHDEVDVRARQQAFGRLDLNLGADEANLEAGLLFFHRARHAQVAEESTVEVNKTTNS